MSRLNDGLKRARLLKEFPRSAEIENSTAFKRCTLERREYDQMLPDARRRYVDHYIAIINPTPNGRRLRKTCRECMNRAVWNDGYISDLG